MGTAQDKRRARDAARNAALVEQQHQGQIGEARSVARATGAAEGRAYGAKVVSQAVLEHAGRLFKEGRDEEARAVRAVHRLLPIVV